MTETPLTLTTPDNVALAGTLFTPEHANGRVVLINSAMGVKRRYYAKYAAFLAEQSFVVVTYDYRGIGDSRHGSLRGNPARFRDWGVIDQGAALDWIAQTYPGQPVVIVGHSLGGQIAGLTSYAGSVRGVLGIGSQSGYWRGWTGIRRVGILAVWYILVPLMVRIFGYLPGRFFGAGEDVPAGVALDWAYGGRHSNYVLSIFAGTPDDHYGELTAPLRLYSFEDDTFAPRETVTGLLGLYPAAQREQKHIIPRDIGVPAIGHFGFFRSAMESTLWQETATWLSEV